MPASDEPQVIQPTVVAPERNAPVTINTAVEKKRKIDEALAAYEKKLSPAASVPEAKKKDAPLAPETPTSHQASTPPRTSTVEKSAALESAPPSPPPSLPVKEKKNERSPILAVASPKRILNKANEALHTGLDKAEEAIEHAESPSDVAEIIKKPVPKPIEANEHVIAPTALESDAAIALRAKQLEAQHQAEEAEAKAKAEAESLRYHPPETVSILKRHKQQFLMLLSVWLISAPLAVGLYMLVAGLFRGDVPLFIMIFLYAIGVPLALYGLLGWVPLIVLYIRKEQA